MSDKTAISWTDATWNPTKGCSRTAPAGSNQSGCGDSTGGGCYAEQQAGRIVRMSKGKPCAYDGLVRLTANGYRWTGKVVLDPKALTLPLRWREHRRIFVDSMSDLFHESLPNEQIAAVFGVMAAAPQHTFQVLTKRAKRMREWFEWVTENRGRTPYVAHEVSMCLLEAEKHVGPLGADCKWPLPNVWIGVSVENQAAADERIPELLRTPAAVRFLSCEPLLGKVDLRLFDGGPLTPRHRLLHWCIAGCESGSGARPCSVEWLRSLRDQCSVAGVPFFLKQARQLPYIEGVGIDPSDPIACGPGSRRKHHGVIELPYLDGEQHAAFPEVSR